MSPYPKIGSLCFVCKIGKLLPVLEAQSNGESTSGIIGLPMSIQVIKRLSCFNCHVCFETNLRGTDVESYIQGQTKDPMPRRLPKICTRCGGKKFASSCHLPSAVRDFSPHPTLEERARYGQMHTYCTRCLLLVRVELSELDKKIELALNPKTKAAAASLLRDFKNRSRA